MTKPHRQRYGLGSFIKKAAKKLKKVVKSPIGKAAALGLGAYFMPGIGAKAAGGWGPWASKIGGWGSRALLGKTGAAPSFTKTGGLWNWMKANKGQAALLGLGTAGVLAPFLGTDEDDEEEETSWNISPPSISNLLAETKDYYRDYNPNLSRLAFQPAKEFVDPTFYSAKGGLAQLANGGGPAEAQAEQMLKMEYQKYRNQGGTMSYQQFKMAVLQQAQQQGPMAQGQPQMMSQGGRTGYKWGDKVEKLSWASPGGAGFNLGKLFAKKVKGADGDEVSTFSEGVDQEFPSDDLGAINTEGLDLELIMSMFKDMTKQGADEDTILSTISTVSGADPSILIRLFNTFAQGGRAGYQGGELVEDASMVEETPTGMMEENVEEVQGEPTREQLEAIAMEIFQLPLEELNEEQLMIVYQAAMEQQPREEMMQEDIEFNPQMAAPAMAAGGGLMSLGGMEKDYRQEGGFVPLGKKEKADDVPARLSKNEFVFTADAVRAAGGGDIDQGAEVMENMMNNLESGGEISEESQGAQDMYDQQQMLQSRMA